MNWYIDDRISGTLHGPYLAKIAAEYFIDEYLAPSYSESDTKFVKYYNGDHQYIGEIFQWEESESIGTSIREKLEELLERELSEESRNDLNVCLNLIRKVKL